MQQSDPETNAPRGTPATQIIELQDGALDDFCSESNTAWAEPVVEVAPPAPEAAAPGPVVASPIPVAPAPAPPPVTRPHAAPSRFSLQEVLARQVTVQWPEAVAIVEELCAVLIRDGRTAVPDLPGVCITAEGDVTAAGGEQGQPANARLGRLLHTLLASSSTPPALRVFVMQVTPGDSVTSVDDFASALAYYARPGRHELIRAVYDRCAAAKPAEPKAEPQPATEPPRPATPARRRIVPRWAAALAALTAASAAAAVVWAIQPASTVAGARALSAIVSGTAASLQSVSTSVRETLGLGVPAAEPHTPGSRPAGGRKTLRREGPAPAGRPRAGDAPAAANLMARSTSAVPSVPPTVASGPVEEDASVRVPAPTETVTIVAGRDPRAIYSTADPDVKPPVMVFPQLPQPLLSNASAPIVNQIELLVSETGTVEEVRMLSRPRRMPDMMMLSGAKAWKFRPAERDGRPVRYRAVLSWTVTP